MTPRTAGSARTSTATATASIDHQTRFAYDGNQIVLEFDKDVPGATSTGFRSLAPLPLAARRSINCWPTNGRTWSAATWRPTKCSGRLTDQQGTVRDLAKLNATTGVTSVVDHVIFNSFGKVTSESDPSQGCLFKYTGRATDTASGTDIEFHDDA